MLKILFLEDDVVLAATVVDFLEDEGFDVKHISNGEEALDATFDEKFDLYIFDVNVPMMNGFELLKSLREADDNTPTFFITALTASKFDSTEPSKSQIFFSFIIFFFPSIHFFISKPIIRMTNHIANPNII